MNRGIASRVLNQAFTLVELMVVIAIIGILTGVVSASLSTSKAKSRDQQRVADISQIQLALAYHLDQYSAYPQTLEDATLKQFLPSLPVDPTQSHAYQYVSFGSCAFPTGYHLGAVLELKSSVLDADKDFDSTSVQKCAGTGFNGVDSENNLIYDVRP